MAADDFVDANDDDTDDITPTRHSAEAYAVAKEVRDLLMPEWNGQNDEVDDLVELTPDGQAIVDGAFSPMELYRIAEGAIEAQRRCAPALAAVPMQTLEQAPQAAAAIHRVRFTVGPMPGSAVDGLFDQAMSGIARHEATMLATTEVALTRQTQIDYLTHQLNQVRAVLKAEKDARAVDATVISPEIMDQLSQAVQAVPTPAAA